MNDEQKAKLIFELSHLFTEFGDSIEDDEADLIESAIATSMNDGIEYIGDDYWSVLYRIFKKYENHDFESDSEGEM